MAELLKGSFMLTPENRKKTIEFLHSLQTESGGFADYSGGPAGLQPTLSVIKALQFFGLSCRNPDAVLSYVKSLYDRSSGAFTDTSAGKPGVFSTALGLLILFNIRADKVFRKYAPMSLGFISSHAKVREEYFMLIGLMEECSLLPAPPSSVAFFRSMENTEGNFGSSLLNNAISASAILRSGENLANPGAVKELLISGQHEDGGFAEKNLGPDMWLSYCAMRTLDLLKSPPRTGPLAGWISGFLSGSGGFATPGNIPSANVTYQALSILNWIISPVMDASRSGGLDIVTKWLTEGGSPDISDLKGWTMLTCSSVMGKSGIVKMLLSDSVPGGKQADPGVRYVQADGLPVYWAGQAGDLESAKILLKKNPEHLFAVNRINGHTILLQAVFFGSEKHLELVRWLLENTGEILGLAETDASKIENARLKLLTACNLRGYNALAMSRLWKNSPMERLLLSYDRSTDAQRSSNYKELLASIKIPSRADSGERHKQELSDKFIETITEGLGKASVLNWSERMRIGRKVKKNIFSELKKIISVPEFDINRLGGPLGSTPIIAAITGSDNNSFTAGLRFSIVSFLLLNKADPDIPENHPMAVDAVIRAAVLNHFRILRLLARKMGPLAFAAALNDKPPVNGQTALHDSVHRALTASGRSLKSHLDQIRWEISKGADYNIKDHTGVSPKELSIIALKDMVFAKRASSVIKALGINIKEDLDEKRR